MLQRKRSHPFGSALLGGAVVALFGLLALATGSSPPAAAQPPPARSSPPPAPPPPRVTDAAKAATPSTRSTRPTRTASPSSNPKSPKASPPAPASSSTTKATSSPTTTWSKGRKSRLPRIRRPDVPGDRGRHRTELRPRAAEGRRARVKLHPLKLGDSSTMRSRRPGGRDRQPLRPAAHRHQRHRLRPAA